MHPRAAYLLRSFMSAREKLYLSYTGQDVKDNEDLPPSIVLDNLLHYLNIQPVKHPVHGFSKRYNNQELFTYLYNSKPETFSVTQTAQTDDDKLREIRLDDFVKFYPNIFKEDHREHFRQLIRHCMYAGIELDGERFALSAIPDEHKIPELQFNFSINGVNKQRINDPMAGKQTERLQLRQALRWGDLPLHQGHPTRTTNRHLCQQTGQGTDRPGG